MGKKRNNPKKPPTYHKTGMSQATKIILGIIFIPALLMGTIQFWGTLARALDTVSVMAVVGPENVN